jgi:hypothetical protein
VLPDNGRLPHERYVSLGMCPRPGRANLNAVPMDHHTIALARARQRRDEAAQGSPDWDAASEAVVELESSDMSPLGEQLRRRLYVVEALAAS